jgi:hypothetical protein
VSIAGRLAAVVAAAGSVARPGTVRRLLDALRALDTAVVLRPQESHAPLVEAAWPGSCDCGLRIEDPVHGLAGRVLASRLRSRGRYR